jgi:hypothetical protein
MAAGHSDNSPKTKPFRPVGDFLGEPGRASRVIVCGSRLLEQDHTSLQSDRRMVAKDCRATQASRGPQSASRASPQHTKLMWVASHVL